MKCVICRQSETRLDSTTVTLERDGLTVVYKNVPAQVCPNCGEDYVDASVAEGLLRQAEQLARVGTQVEIRRFEVADAELLVCDKPRAGSD